MNRLLGPLLLVALVAAGCGDSTGSTASDAGDGTVASTPATSSTASPTGSPIPTMPTLDPTAGVDAQTVAIVSQTAAGGEVDLTAVPVDDAAARQQFTAQFRRPGMDKRIAQAVASATTPEGWTIMAAVVSIGCDVPPDVTVSQGPDGYVLRPHKVDSPLQECFAPVTSVAVVAVPA